jgi:hypothetical protein
MKLDSRFHRTAVQQLEPNLMQFSEYGVTEQMRPNGQFFYWLRKNRVSSNYVSYVNTAFFANDEFDTLFREHAHMLSGIISDKLILRISSNKTRLATDARLFWALLPLALFLSKFHFMVKQRA